MIRGKKYTFVLLFILLWTLPLLACRKQPISPTPDPTPTLTADATPTDPDAPLYLTLHDHNTFVDRSGALHFVGQALNHTAFSCASPRATVRYYDGSGTEIAQQAGPVHVDILLPGEKAPFKLSLWDPPPGIDSFKLTISGLQTTARPFADVTFGQSRAHVDGDSVTIVGLVQNEGTDAASQVRIAAALYDKEDVLVDVAAVSAPLTVLPPDGASPFWLVLSEPHVDGLPARYDLIAYSRRASEAEQSAQARVAVADTHNDTNAVKDLVLLGEIANTGSQNATTLEAYASFYDAQGQILAVDQGYVWADVLAAGTRSPFLFELFGTPDEVDHWQIWVQGKHTDRPIAGPLTVVETQSWVDGEGIATFDGSIRNDGVQELAWIEVAVTVYGAEGRILSTGWTVLPGSLAPGESKPFRFQARTAGAASSFHLSAQGQRPGREDGS